MLIQLIEFNQSLDYISTLSVYTHSASLDKVLRGSFCLCLLSVIHSLVQLFHYEVIK